MNVFNRVSMVLLSLTWCALLAAIVYLIWEPSRFVNIQWRDSSLVLTNIASTQAEQMLATIAAIFLMIPAVLLLAAELCLAGRGVGATPRVPYRPMSRRNRQTREHGTSVPAMRLKSLNRGGEASFPISAGDNVLLCGITWQRNKRNYAADGALAARRASTASAEVARPAYVLAAMLSSVAT